MNLKSTDTNGFKFPTINSLVQSWWVRLTGLDCNVCIVQDSNTCESKVVGCAVYCKRRELCFFQSCLTICDPLEQSDRKLYDEVSEDKHRPLYSIECFHMTSRRPCWCPKPVLWEMNCFLMQTLSFVPINLHRCWPREWKHSILGSLSNSVFEQRTSTVFFFSFLVTYHSTVFDLIIYDVCNFRYVFWSNSPFSHRP